MKNTFEIVTPLDGIIEQAKQADDIFVDEQPVLKTRGTFDGLTEPEIWDKLFKMSRLR